MRGILTLVPVLSLIVVALAPHASALQSWKPTAAESTSAFVDGVAGAGVVSWQPGTQLADKYNVYGMEGTSFVFLTTAIGLSTPVPGGYSGYAVSGVLNGVESDKTMAIGPCVAIDPSSSPPTVGICPSPAGAPSIGDKAYLGEPRVGF